MVAVSGMDPGTYDTDSDGLPDNDEVNIHGSDLLDYHTDQNGTNDGLEVAAGTNPFQPSPPGQQSDFDGDGLRNDDEANVLNTNPTEFDSDVDGEELSRGLDTLTTNGADVVGPSPKVVDAEAMGSATPPKR